MMKRRKRIIKPNFNYFLCGWRCVMVVKWCHSQFWCKCWNRITDGWTQWGSCLWIRKSFWEIISTQ